MNKDNVSLSERERLLTEQVSALEEKIRQLTLNISENERLNEPPPFVDDQSSILDSTANIAVSTGNDGIITSINFGTETAIENRISTISRPLGDSTEITFEDLFDLSDIQHLQDLFSEACDVASIITQIDGTPITEPSNFCTLCNDIIRKTEKGQKNCFLSDSIIGRQNSSGPVVQPCLSGGLWDAGANITVGGRHIANWLIGQVRNETQGEEQMLAYAKEIGANEQDFIEAFRQVPEMSQERFEKIAEMLFFTANQLSSSAYQNIQQARFITELKRAEEILARNKDQLELTVEQRTAELRIARDDAESANRAKSDFLASMSHEIRTPMNAILGMLYLVLKSDMAPNVREKLSKAENAAKSLLGIINDILDFSKIEAGMLDVEKVAFDLEATVQQQVNTLVLSAEDKGLELLVRYDVNIPSRLIGDPLRIGQILLNLCNNAIKFTEVGEVELSFKVEDMSDNTLTLLIIVRDTGIGMTAKQQLRLFQKFTQADQSNTRLFGGTGLGLTISKNLAELMGGSVWVEQSKPDQGTTMGCRLQLGIAPKTAPCRTILLEDAGALLKGTRVLVVEDNEIQRQIFSETLSQFQLEVDTANDGEMAYERLLQSNSKPYDVILMDWHLPGINGSEATQRILADPGINPQPKVIMVTAYGREDVIQSAENSGVDGFLTKPISPSTLLDSLLSTLGRERIILPSREIQTNQAADTIPTYFGARLLLAEDNEISREFAEELLQGLGVEVTSVTNGAQAVEKVKQTAFDGVLMDIQMPELDGLEATRRIRALSQTTNDRFSSVPIIAMTALAMTGDREKSLAAGMTDHITKPIDPDRLMAVLSQWLEVPEEQQRHAAEINNLANEKAPDAELLAMKNIDTAQGIRRIGGKPKAFRKQLHRFYEHYANATETLQQQITERGLEAGEAYCHVLKGVCGNLGARALYSCVTELDNMLKLGRQPRQEHFEEMDRLLNDVIREIEGLSITKEASAASTQPLSTLDLAAKLEKLSLLLERDLSSAETLLEELGSEVVASDLKDAIGKLNSMVDAFEIDDALILIKAMLTRLEKSV